jgi:RNA polymerase primary sigma factor
MEMVENLYKNLQETDISFEQQEADDELLYEDVESVPETNTVLSNTVVEQEFTDDDEDGDFMEGSSSQDTDTLSLYLAECRRTTLLDVEMEKELSGKIELGRVLSDLQTDWISRNGREISHVDMVTFLIERMAGNRPVFEQLCNYLNVPEREKLSGQCMDVTLRKAIDGTIDKGMTGKIAELLGTDEEDVEKNIVLLSVDMRLIPWSVLDKEHNIQNIGDLEVMVYRQGFMQTIAHHTDAIKRHFDMVRDEAHNVSNILVQSNLRLVVSIAKKRKAPSMTMSDFIQEGNIGLMKAAWRFDHRLGYRFSTYATWWIRQAMGRAVQEQSRIIRLPGHMVDAIREVKKARERFQLEQTRMPSEKELAEKLGITVKKLNQILQANSNQMVSLETPIGDDGGQLGDLIEDHSTPEPESQALNSLMWGQIQEILGTLTERERKVIEIRFGLIDKIDRTLEEVGKELGLTKERIRQIERQALAKLRHPYNSRRLENCFK